MTHVEYAPDDLLPPPLRWYYAATVDDPVDMKRSAGT
jgi:hypothetical protein